MENGVAKSYETAKEWYMKCINLEGGKAALWIADMYLNNEIVNKDIEKALEWYLEIFKWDIGDLDDDLDYIFEQIGNIYYEKEEYQSAIKWYHKIREEYIIDLGIVTIKRIGVIYNNGWGVEKSYENAKQWYLKSVSRYQDFIDIGMLYEFGEGVECSAERAMEWYQKAIDMAGDQGWCAIFDIGEMYYKKEEYTKALPWLSKALKLGDMEALVIIGNIYFIQHNYSEAAKCYLTFLRKIKDDEYPFVIKRLGDMYYKGLGVEKNDYVKLFL